MSRSMQGLRGSQLIWDCSLLYPLRHPDFLRKSCSGGLPYGALGRGMISIRERGRAVVVVLAAEPGATTSQMTFSLCKGTLLRTGSDEPAPPPAGPVARRPGPSLSAGSQRSAQYVLSLLTQARIPS